MNINLHTQFAIGDLVFAMDRDREGHARGVLHSKNDYLLRKELTPLKVVAVTARIYDYGEEQGYGAGVHISYDLAHINPDGSYPISLVKTEVDIPESDIYTTCEDAHKASG